MKLAVFDFDGTIYKKETFTLLMQHLKTTYPKKYRRFFATILPIYIGYKMKLIAEVKMKARLMEQYINVLNDFNESEMNTYFENAAHQMEGNFNKTVIERLRAHQQAGDYTIILSGAFTPLLSAVNKQLKLDCHALIGTEIPSKGNSFDHVHAEQKPVFLFEHVKKHSINWKESTAYGDSFTDLSVLELVGYPVAVCPDKALAQIAAERGWETINKG